MTSSSAHESSGLLNKLKSVVSRGRVWLGSELRVLFSASPSEEAFEELETRLLLADVGVSATKWLIDELRREVTRSTAEDTSLVDVLQSNVLELLARVEQPLTIEPAHRPFVVLMVGVNGAGKITTLGKLASRLSERGHSVMLAAGDTFRAAAIEQLTEWGERTRSSVIVQAPGTDPAAVVFDALGLAVSTSLLLIPPAGPIHPRPSWTNLRKCAV